MLTKLQRLLVEDGLYSRAIMYAKDTQHGLDDDPPNEVDVVKCVGRGGYIKEYVVTSTRLIVIAQGTAEISRLGDEYGFVCADNARIEPGDTKPKTDFVLPGGRLRNDFNLRAPDEEHPGKETPLECALQEMADEVGLILSPERLFLVCLRPITERNKDGVLENKIEHGGRVAVDAMFIAIAPERLGVFHGQPTETGDRHVMSARDLLWHVSSTEQKVGRLPRMPHRQQLALANVLTCAKEIFGHEPPAPLKEVLASSARAVEHFARFNENKMEQVVRVIQDAPWEV